MCFVCRLSWFHKSFGKGFYKLGLIANWANSHDDVKQNFVLGIDVPQLNGGHGWKHNISLMVSLSRGICFLS